MSKRQRAGDGESAHGQHTSAEAKQTVVPLNPAFKQRFGPVGEALAKELAAFSLDVVGIVAAYVVCGVVNGGEEMQELSSFGWGLTGSPCYGVASSPHCCDIWTCYINSVVVFDSDGKHLFSATPAGCRPHSVVFDSDGTAFVSCCFDSLIVACNPDASVLRTIGSKGSGDGQLTNPRGVAVHGEQLFVADSGNHRIVVFNKTTGEFIRSWPIYGDNNGQFGVAVSANGEVFVSDYGIDRIQVPSIRTVALIPRMQVFDVGGSFLRTLGREGRGPGQFQTPRGVAIDSAGNVLVCDCRNKRVQALTPRGSFITEIPCAGIFDGEPFSICVDLGARILVGCNDGTVRVFAFVV